MREELSGKIYIHKETGKKYFVSGGHYTGFMCGIFEWELTPYPEKVYIEPENILNEFDETSEIEEYWYKY